VVVVGFGPAGAGAALAAAGAGARVVALSGRPVDGAAQALALAAGVEVRRAVAGELDVQLGRVVGVGYAAPPEVTDCPLCDCSTAAAARCAPAGHLACAAVVLAVDAGHWDFVGCAVWSAVRDRAPAVPAPGPVGRITPELAVRRWCAERDAGPAAAAAQAPLQVDGTGAVTVGGDLPVVGLYSAVPAEPGGPPDVDAARRAGVAAARTAVPGVLRPVG
jgi:hypothetical protein